MTAAFSVPGVLDGERVDRALSLLCEMPRSQAAALVDAGAVCVGGKVVSSRSQRVLAGQELTAALPDPPDRRLRADAGVEVRVVYEDPSVLVVDKAAGVVVHPGAGRREGTLAAGLLSRYPQLADLAGDDEAPAAGDRPGIVHRLDKGTSGLLLVARTPAAREALVSQLAARAVERLYLALLRGGVDSDAGVVDAPIGRSRRDPTRRALASSGRPARTHYKVVERFELPEALTLVECRLESGRTHQIRVHMAAIGHPVVGDDRYGTGQSVSGQSGSGPRSGRGGGAPAPAAGRNWLHAWSLAWDDPVTGERRSVRSELPPDLVGHLDALRAVATA